MAPLKVIGAGCGRTGTDSLRTALNILGYNTHHAKCFWEEPAYNNSDEFYDAYLNRDTANWDKLYEHYDAAVDWPTVAFYKDLLVKYPTAKVILTIRSADSWYKSIKNTVHRAHTESREFPPGHASYSFGKMIKAVSFDGILSDPEQFKDEEKIKKIYLDHIKDVKKTVPVEQLLVMELGEGWESLCKFLGKDVPNEPYPNVNSTAKFLKDLEGVFDL